MDAIWLKSYPANVPAEVDLNTYHSLIDLIEKTVSTYKDSIAFSNLGHSLTYAEIDKLSLQCASYFQNELGLKKGDAIALMMPNLLQYPVAVYGALRAGLRIVNINPLYTVRELKHVLKDSQAKAIIILENFASTLEKSLDDVSVEHIITTKMGDLLPFLKATLINVVIKHVKKMVPPFSLPNARSFKDVISQGDVSRYQRPQVDRNDIGFLQYTGGTTGVSKGALLSHGNLIANTKQVLAWLQSNPECKITKAVCPLPLYHIFALMADCFGFFSLGAESILITNPRDIPRFIKTIKDAKFSAIVGVNTLFRALMSHPDFKTIDFSALTLTLGGGMAVEKAVAEQWQKLTGKPLIEAYGLTESSPAVCINPLDIDKFEGCIGLPISNTLVSIRNDQGEELGIDEEGELWVKGPQVFQGYWQKEEETKNTLTEDGWLKTGDIAAIDQRGFVRILDRKKDMVIVSGFNVYPNEIEDVVGQHDKVLEACAIGVPDSRSGEAVKLFVVKKDESLTEKEVVDYCRENLVAYKVPKQIEWKDELPKTNVGKILRKDLRDPS